MGAACWNTRYHSPYRLYHSPYRKLSFHPTLALSQVSVPFRWANFPSLDLAEGCCLLEYLRRELTFTQSCHARHVLQHYYPPTSTPTAASAPPSPGASEVRYRHSYPVLFPIYPVRRRRIRFGDMLATCSSTTIPPPGIGTALPGRRSPLPSLMSAFRHIR
jgi:hypothetical protein